MTITSPHSLSRLVGAGVLLAALAAQAASYEYHQRVVGLVPAVQGPAEGASCAAILAAGKSQGSGIYTLTPEGSSPLTAYCDMSTDGGGWTLALNYLHRGGTNPALAPLTDRLPLKGADALGIDESGDPQSWGHTAPSLFATLAPSEVRFQCQTSLHGRQIHFRTGHAAMIGYFATGSGAAGISPAQVLPGHSAFLPTGTDATYADQGELAMTNFPFYRNANYHWGIKGNGTRWECDDYNRGSGHHTLHRIWVR